MALPLLAPLLGAGLKAGLGMSALSRDWTRNSNSYQRYKQRPAAGLEHLEALT